MREMRMGVLCCWGCFFGVVVGLGLVSIIEEFTRVFPTNAERTIC